MRVFQLNSEIIFPSDPAKIACLPGKLSKLVPIDAHAAQIHPLAEAQNQRGRTVIAAVGPIACTACDLRCKDAYAVLDEHGVTTLKRNTTQSTTPVTIQLPAKSSGINVQAVIEREADSLQTPSTLYIDQSGNPYLRPDI